MWKCSALIFNQTFRSFPCRVKQMLHTLMMKWLTSGSHFNFCSIFMKGRQRISVTSCVFMSTAHPHCYNHPIWVTIIALSTERNCLTILYPTRFHPELNVLPPPAHTYIPGLFSLYPPPPSSSQWTEAGAGRGGQSLPPAVTAELLQPALLHPLLLALHIPAQPQAPVPRLPLQRLQGLPGLQQAGPSLAVHRLPEEQVMLLVAVVIVWLFRGVCVCACLYVRVFVCIKNMWLS